MRSKGDGLGLSVAWSYLFALLLMTFILVILVPDADGPSPWDRQAFDSGVLEMLANFRILDDAADLGIVRVADVGEGWFNAELDLIVVSDRRFGWAPFYLAVLFGSLALLLRGIRQRFLARRLEDSVLSRGLFASYFFGRGLNLFFPFGPGELAAAQTLVDGGAAPETAAKIVFQNRVFEMAGLLIVLLAGFTYLGWEGAVLPACWTLLLLMAVVSLTRPLGRGPTDAPRWNPLKPLWSAFNGPAVVETLKPTLQTPGHVVGMLSVSVVALGLEILGYWCLKQAFSSPLDDYVLMKDLPFIHFAIVIAVANAARVLPYTFASVGVYEVVSVAMFRMFGEGFLGGATVSLLDSLFINSLTLIAFLTAICVGHCPSVFDSWRAFVDRSEAQQPQVEAV